MKMQTSTYNTNTGGFYWDSFHSELYLCCIYYSEKRIQLANNMNFNKQTNNIFQSLNFTDSNNACLTEG